jgi:acyl-coenzyme A thioesterase PaaI-like protein
MLRRILPDVEKEGNLIRSLWDRLSPLPGGRTIYSRLLCVMAPYTGTINPRVEELRRGYCRVTMRDRRGIRNHLRSVHAIALINIGEVAGNLALAYSLPDNARFIPVGISIEYYKKARGTITGIGEAPILENNERQEYKAKVSLRNDSDEEVARVVLTTLVGPKR